MDENSLEIVFYAKEDPNSTDVQDFYLVAFSNLKQLQVLLFILVLLAYLICVTGNVTIMILVGSEPSLQTPMYFFISTFAILEILFVTVTVPNLLKILISGDTRISRLGCFTQLYIFNGLGSTECYLLVIMAFDRNLAINSPLRYSAIMRKELYTELAVAPWLAGFAFSSLTTGFMANLKFCGANQINHFICDLTPLQAIACSDTYASKLTTILSASFAIIFSVVMIVTFYAQIINTISKIKSAEGKKKAFSTCSSHLIVAGLFFGAAFLVYILPFGGQIDKFLALLYTVLTPSLNPFIYTLRNSDVKSAVKNSRVLKKIQSMYGT
ncbi:olfactory receptor 10A4-like [Gastrophryne carolinensis]